MQPAIRIVPFLSLLLTVLPGIVAAQDAASWSKHRVTLYGWGANLDGSLRIAPLPELSVRRSFSDTLSALDFGAMAVFETRGDRWGLLFDLQAAKLSDSGRAPLVGAPGRIETELVGALAAASYRAHANARSYLDVLVGLRHWSIDSEARIRVPPGTPLPFPTSATDSRSITAPQLGIKGYRSFGNSWFVTGWLMAGAVDNTDLAADAMLALGYTLSERTSLMLGYRRVDLEYDGNRFDLDLSFQGPGLALDFRFR